MIRPEDVTACLVTRGDQPEMMERIRASLIFDRVEVWDNSVEAEDWKCAGRYAAAERAVTALVYFQDDDVIVPPETQRALLDEYRGEDCLSNWAHGSEPAGYDDVPLVGAGAVVRKQAIRDAIWRYTKRYPLDDAFGYECDFVLGVLYKNWRHVFLPFEPVLEVAQHPSRLVNQPWQRRLKFETCNRARRIRDADETAEYADWYLENYGVPS